jgi:hypothetical protein
MTERTPEQRLRDFLQLEEKSGAGDLEMVLHKRKAIRLDAVYSSMAGLSQTRGMHILSMVTLMDCGKIFLWQANSP